MVAVGEYIFDTFRTALVLFTSFVFVLRIVVSNTYCVVMFVLFVYRLMYPLLPVSLDCPFLIVPSIFSNIYLIDIDGLRNNHIADH